VIALTGRDDLVFIVGLLAYGLYGLLVAAMAERWWGRGALHTCAAVLLSLGIPTTLLSSGAQKNDLLLAALLLGAAHFGARWAVRGERACLLLAITAAAIAIGTKPTAGVLVLALAPCVVWRMRARRREGLPLVAREAAHWFGVAIASGLLLGGEVYVMNLATIGAPWGHIAGTRYGEWHHLWAFPALAFLRGLSPTDSVWVPWRHQTWFWSQWDLFFSSYGAPTSLLTLSLPWAVARYRREGLRAERALATGVLVLAFLAMLPVGVQEPPYGFFVGYVRYTSYVPVVVVLWTAVPWIRAHARDARAAYGALVVASACFALYAIGCMNNDIYAPLSFVLDVRHGDRFARAQRSWTLRAGGVVDRFAGQDDVIAFDGGLDSWSYPAYGRELRRTVIYLHPDRGPVVIGDDVKWVVVDRAWHALFGHPKMTDLGVWFEYIAKGSPLPEDVVVLHQLENDPRWKLVWREDYANQAVFMRVPPAK
jgi:hypothetical protein